MSLPVPVEGDLESASLLCDKLLLEHVSDLGVHEEAAGTLVPSDPFDLGEGDLLRLLARSVLFHFSSLERDDRRPNRACPGIVEEMVLGSPAGEVARHGVVDGDCVGGGGESTVRWVRVLKPLPPPPHQD